MERGRIARESVDSYPMTAHPASRRLATALGLTLLVLVNATAVSADTTLLETIPGADATLDGAPDRIVATFDQALGADASSIILRGPNGDDLAEGGVDPDEPTTLLIDVVPELGPGEYQVRWTAASADGHLIRDTWTFVIEAAAPTPAPTPSPSEEPSAPPSAAPSPTPASSDAPSPTASPAPDDGPAADTTDILIPILVLVALVALGGVYLMRRRGTAA